MSGNFQKALVWKIEVGVEYRIKEILCTMLYDYRNV